MGTGGTTAKSEMGELPAVYRGASRFVRVPLAFHMPMGFLMAAIVLFTDHPWAALIAIVSMVAAFAAQCAPSRVVVGTDGISVRWLGRSRFFAREAIATVTAYEQGFAKSRYNGIAIALKDGTTVKVPLENENAVGPALRSARALLGVAESDPNAASTMVLARGDRSHATWLANLRAIGAGKGDGFRVAAVSRDELWSVVANASASPQERAAAAFALRVAPDEETKEHLLRVAEATAEPRLRALLECTTAEQAEAELEQAMIEFDQSDEARG